MQSYCRSLHVETKLTRGGGGKEERGEEERERELTGNGMGFEMSKPTPSDIPPPTSPPPVSWLEFCCCEEIP